MPEIVCGLDSILNPDDCKDRGGIRALYWFNVADVDWDAMYADETKFDATNQLILGYTMVASGVMHELTFQRETAYYDFTFTEDADLYELLVSLVFEGKDADRRNTLMNAIQCCKVGLHIYGNNGHQRVVGIDYSGTGFDNQLKSMRISRHLDSGGQLGTSKSRDEMDLGGKAFFAPLFATVAEADLPL